MTVNENSVELKRLFESENVLSYKFETNERRG